MELGAQVPEQKRLIYSGWINTLAVYRALGVKRKDTKGIVSVEMD